MYQVASFSEAWIEIIERVENKYHQNIVASFSEAWIEIIEEKIYRTLKMVASFSEAWIEIMKKIAKVLLRERRLLLGGVD